MKFISIKNWLTEQKKEEPVYGCVMMEPKKIKDWKENHLDGIEEDDIFIKETDDSYGLEEQPHITVLYGIHEDEVDPSVVVDMIEQKMKPLKVKISEISIFENKDYDVVKYDVPVTPELKKYRKMFMDSFEHTLTFPKYHPHITIAYVKSGTGSKYKRKLDEPFEVEFTKGVYSYHKEGKDGDLIRRVVNLEPKKDKSKDNNVVKSKPLDPK